MKKFFLFLTLLTLGVGLMWGATESITASNGVYSSGTHTWNMTSCTVVQAKGNSTSNVNSSYPDRWYQNHLITFTPKSGYTISKIELNGTSGSYNGQDMTVTSGGGSLSKNSNKTTWSGTATSAVTIKMGSQFRFGSVTITYSSSASCTTNPTVSAGSNSSVTATTARVSCSSGITSLGSAGCSISSYGFVIGESANPAINGSGVTQHEVGTSYTTTNTSFYKDLTGLSESTTYYVRPYATNGNGTAYGTQTSFSTPALPKDHFIDEVQGSVVADKTSAYNFSSVTIGDKSAKTSGSCEEQHYHFVGWITKEKYDAGTSISNSDIQTGNKTPNNSTYYAVWAKGTDNSTSKNYTLSLSNSDVPSSYTGSWSNATAEEVGEGEGTLPVSFDGSDVGNYNSKIQFKKSTGYFYNTTDLGSITSITTGNNNIAYHIGTSQNPSSGTSGGYFKIYNTQSSAQTTTNITIAFTKSSGSVTYSDYIAKCCTQLGSINGSVFWPTLFSYLTC